MRAIDIDMSIYDDDDAGAEGGGDIIFNIKKCHYRSLPGKL